MSPVERQYFIVLWVCLQRTVFPLSIVRVTSILEIRKTVLSGKGEVFKVQVLIFEAIWKAKEKYLLHRGPSLLGT